MKRGIAVWNYPGDCVENAYAFHKMGFDAVSWLGRHFDAHTEQEDARVAQCVRDTGMLLTVHHRMPNPLDAQAVDVFLRGMEHIAQWEAKYGLLAGITFDFNHPYDALMPLLAAVLQTFRGSDIFIACEDAPLDARQYEAFLPAIDARDYFGVLVDAGHMNLRQTASSRHTDADFVAALRTLPVPLLEVHLSDNGGDHDAHASLGTGTLPLHAFVQGLQAVGFDGIATVERVPRDETTDYSRAQGQACMELFMQTWETEAAVRGREKESHA